MAATTVKRKKPAYWVNSRGEFYWEIVGPDDQVHKFMDKAKNSRAQAQRTADMLNRRLADVEDHPTTKARRGKA